MKENLKLREDTFRKMGWTHIKASPQDIHYAKNTYWEAPETLQGTEIHRRLPPIESQWEVTAKYLVPFMRERNYNYSLSGIQNKLGMVFIWYGGHMSMDRTAEIKDNNIAEAACESFLEVEL